MNHSVYIYALHSVLCLFQVSSSMPSIIPAHSDDELDQSVSNYPRFHNTQDMNKNMPGNGEIKYHVDLIRRTMRRGIHIHANELINHVGRKHTLAKLFSNGNFARAKASPSMKFQSKSRNIHLNGNKENVRMLRNDEENVHFTENAHLVGNVEHNAHLFGNVTDMIGGAEENVLRTGAIKENARLVRSGEENEQLNVVIQESAILTRRTEENKHLSGNDYENIAGSVVDTARGFSSLPDENLTNESSPLAPIRLKRSDVCHGPRCNICPWRNEIQTDASRLPFRVMTRVCSAPSPVGSGFEHLVCSPLRVNMAFRLRHCSETAPGSCVVMAPVTVGCYAAYRLNSDVTQS